MGGKVDPNLDCYLRQRFQSQLRVVDRRLAGVSQSCRMAPYNFAGWWGSLGAQVALPGAPQSPLVFDISFFPVGCLKVSTVVLRLFICFTCPAYCVAITVATVILWRLLLISFYGIYKWELPTSNYGTTLYGFGFYFHLCSSL